MMTFLFFLGGGIIMTLVFILLIILFPLVALVSALTGNFPENEKIIWVLLIIFLPFLGSLLYFLIGTNQRR